MEDRQLESDLKKEDLMKKLIIFAIYVLSISQSAEARVVSVIGGIGNWYSDDLRSSYQYGGGILVRPGLEWLEFSATFDRAPVMQKTGGRWATELRDEALNFYRLGVTFPSTISAMGLKAYLFPLLAYVVTTNASNLTHGVGVGGGLEFMVWRDIIGARFEALEQIYKIPTSSGDTGVQEDFFFALRLSVSY